MPKLFLPRSNEARLGMFLRTHFGGVFLVEAPLDSHFTICFLFDDVNCSIFFTGLGKNIVKGYGAHYLLLSNSEFKYRELGDFEIFFQHQGL